MKASVLLLDGLAMAYRAYFGVKGLSSGGTATNAVYGFVRMARQLQNVWKPERTAAAFDGGSPAHRLAACPGYKAQRAPMPEELRAQLPLIEEFLKLSGIPSVRIERQEADDVLATLAEGAAAGGAVVRIATGDKDLMQLVREEVRLVAPGNAESELDAEGVLAKTGVRPGQIADWLAMTGDAADNIPGMGGVGPKTATKLLQRFGTLEGCLARAGEIEQEGLRKKVEEGGEVARKNLGVVRLDRAVEGVPGWEELAWGEEDGEGLVGFFERLGMASLAREQRERNGKGGEASSAGAGGKASSAGAGGKGGSGGGEQLSLF